MLLSAPLKWSNLTHLTGGETKAKKLISDLPTANQWQNPVSNPVLTTEFLHFPPTTQAVWVKQWILSPSWLMATNYMKIIVCLITLLIRCEILSSPAPTVFTQVTSISCLTCCSFTLSLPTVPFPPPAVFYNQSERFESKYNHCQNASVTSHCLQNKIQTLIMVSGFFVIRTRLCFPPLSASLTL